MFENIIGVFFTKTCPVCGKVVAFNQKGVCNSCKDDVKYVRDPYCRRCGRPIKDMYQMVCTSCAKDRNYFDKGMCLFEHSGGIRSSIYDFKYNNRRGNGAFYAKEAKKVFGKELKELRIQAIIPVPIHKEREIERGYNQSLEFAQQLARVTGIPVEKRALIRRKNTAPQKELTEIMRYLNLKNAFAVDRSLLGGLKNVLIVDDIFTTGSTINACSSILKKAGVEKVYFLCISAGVGR